MEFKCHHLHEPCSILPLVRTTSPSPALCSMCHIPCAFRSLVGLLDATDTAPRRWGLVLLISGFPTAPSAGQTYTPVMKWVWTSTLHSKKIRGLPWGRSGWESACQCRGHGFEPWSGRIPHAAEQLGPWATITEPVRLEPVLRNKRGRDSERPAHRDEEWPPLAATRESPCTETKTQHSHK